MAGSITSASAILQISVATIFPTPQQIQQFSADNIFEIDELEVAETSMGVDGVLSAGWVWNEVSWNISLQANSPSNALFDQWYQAEQTAQDKYAASGIVTLKSIGTKFILSNGFLKRFTPMPAAGKTLHTRRFGIAWNKVSAAPSPT